MKTLHQAGIEVILNVVYNHTAEGNHLGPALSFKGIDNRAYYRLADGGRYFDTTAPGTRLAGVAAGFIVGAAAATQRPISPWPPGCRCS